MDNFNQVRAFIRALKTTKALIDSGLTANLSQIYFTCYGKVISGGKGNTVTLCGYLRQARQAGLLEARPCEEGTSNRGVKPRAYRLTDAFVFCHEHLHYLERYGAFTNETAYKTAWALFGEEMTPLKIAVTTGMNEAAIKSRLNALAKIVSKSEGKYRLDDHLALEMLDRLSLRFAEI